MDAEDRELFGATLAAATPAHSGEALDKEL